MPLSLDVPSDQPEVVSWEPTPEGEKEALDRIDWLKSQGYSFKELNRKEGYAKMLPPSLPENMGLMRVISENGDDRIIWDRGSADEVRDAAKKVQELKAKGHTAYYAKTDGGKGAEMEEFDPFSEEAIILVPKRRPG